VFVQDATLLAHVQAVLAVEALDPATPWTAIAHYANVAAYGQIRRALMLRGLSQAQVDSWDDGAEYQLDLGLFWALTKGGCTKDYDQKFIQALDRRDELKTAYLTTGGAPVVPATSRVARGAMVDSVNDIFALTDRDLWDWEVAALGDNGQGQGGGFGVWPGVSNINESG
jgi:hypothetical protein